MSAVKSAARKPNLLLCLDAFGTLFTPRIPIAKSYAEVAAQHGIDCGPDATAAVGASFKSAFKQQSHQNPNYGKAAGMTADDWWGSVIRHTFKPFLKADQKVSHDLVRNLLLKFSTKEGYRLYDDVQLMFQQLRHKTQNLYSAPAFSAWDNVVVGIITNSDNRVPDVLGSLAIGVEPMQPRQLSPAGRRAALGLDINFITTSYDAGFEKPDSRVFETAFKTFADLLDGHESLKAHDFERLYVGDEVQKDYEGARAAGWDSLLIRREEEDDSHGSDTDVKTINSLIQLASYGMDE